MGAANGVVFDFGDKIHTTYFFFKEGKFAYKLTTFESCQT